MTTVSLTVTEQVLLQSLVFIFAQTFDGDCFAIFPKAFWNQHHRNNGEEDGARDAVLEKLGFERLTETEYTFNGGSGKAISLLLSVGLEQVELEPEFDESTDEANDEEDEKECDDLGCTSCPGHSAQGPSLICPSCGDGSQVVVHGGILICAGCGYTEDTATGQELRPSGSFRGQQRPQQPKPLEIKPEVKATKKEIETGERYVEIHVLREDKGVLPFMEGRPSRAWGNMSKEDMDDRIAQTKEAATTSRLTVFGSWAAKDELGGFFIGHQGRWHVYEADPAKPLEINADENPDMARDLVKVGSMLSEDRKFKQPDWIEEFKDAIHDGDLDRIKDIVETQGRPLVYTPESEFLEESYFLDNVLLKKKDALEKARATAAAKADQQDSGGGCLGHGGPQPKVDVESERAKMIRELQTYKGWSALEECIKGPHPGIAYYLLSRGDLDQLIEVPGDDEPSVEVDSTNGGISAVLTGPDPEKAKTKWVKTSTLLLDQALRLPGSSTYEAVKLLLSAGAETEGAFMLACRNGKRDVIAQFLEADGFNILDHEEAVREAAVHADQDALDLIRLYDPPEDWLNSDPW